MSQTFSTKYIKFVTVRRPAAFVVFAFLCETINGQTRIISEPRIVKIISKKANCEIAGAILNENYYISEFKENLKKKNYYTVSPYSNYFSKEKILVSVSARAPTLK